MAKTNRIFQTCLPQFQCLQHGGHAKETALMLQQSCHLDGAMTIGIRLDHRHDLGTGFGRNMVKIPGNGIQIDGNIGIIEIQKGSTP